jgi:hypothetical protein
MRRSLLLVLLVACAPPATELVPLDAGLVSLERTDDGGTLWLYGQLSAESFTVDSMRAHPARLASRSPDPDEFRVVLLDASGEPRRTMSTWSPLGVHVWDSAGVRESYRTDATRRTAIPVPIHHWLARVRLGWPSGAAVAEVDVSAAVKRFCARHPQNPSCRA